METISRESFSMQAETSEQLTANMLKVAGYTEDTYISQMGITADSLALNHIWVQNHLADVIHANFVHLGYIMKDTKTSGMLGEFNTVSAELEKAQIDSDTSYPPITIQGSIVAEDGTIHISYLSNSTQLLKDTLASL